MDGITVVPKVSETPISPSYVADDIHPIAGMLGLDTHKLSDTDKTNLGEIYAFIRGDAKEMVAIDLLHKIRELEGKLGMTSLGERRVDKLYRYVKLQSQIDKLTNARDSELR